MAENPDPDETGKLPHGAPTPRKSSDVLTNRPTRVRQRAAQAERKRNETVAWSRKPKEQNNSLHEAPKLSTGEAVTTNQGKPEALRQELDLVRTRAAANLEALRQQLSKTSRGDTATRNVELEAELQAVRQEAAVLRQAVKEKEKVLEELAAQCRSLEDALEDRDREMDRLHQDLEKSRSGSALYGDPGTRVLGVDSMGIVGHDSDPLYVFPDTDTSEILDGASLFSPPPGGRLRRTVWLAAAAGLLAGVLVVAAVLLILVWGGTSLGEAVTAQEALKRQPSYEVPAVSGRNTAKSAAVSASAESQPVLV